MKFSTIAALLCTALIIGLTTSAASAGHYDNDDAEYYDGHDDEYDDGFPRCGCCHLYCGFGYRSPSDWQADDDEDGDDGDYDGRPDDSREPDDRDDDDYYGS